MERTPSEEVLDELGIPPGVLTEREALVLALRMGFVDGKAHTLEGVAAFLGAPPSG
ncbi:hypothetical protein [Thermus sp.]|uniref:hypothetical protein n=1 Tax=Thermus sp. TaxID=275 RepID=UPI0025D5DC87|nr:hypothetical protein [Thermus sp.]MCS6869186.1 hypothetical protein [Thermus sp.]